MPAPADPRISVSAAYAEGEWMVVGGRDQKPPTRLADILHTAPLSAGNERYQTGPTPASPGFSCKGNAD